MRRSCLLAVAAMAVSFAGTVRADEYEDTVARLTSAQPPAIAAIIHRRMACNRWFHYGAYDMNLSASPRAPTTLQRLQCQHVDADERLLRYRYRHAADIKKAMDEADKAVF